MYSISVGKPLNLELKEGLSILNDGLGFQLFINLPNLSKHEIDSFNGKMKIGLFVDEETDIIAFLIEINNLISVSDVFFNINITPKGLDTVEKITNDDYGYAFTTTLVESTTNIVKGMRIVTLSNEFSKILYNRLEKEWKNEDVNNNIKYSQNVEKIMRKYSSSEMWNKRLCDCLYK